MKIFTALLFFVILTTANAYEKNPQVSDVIWETASKYFLPEDHPMKTQMDKIFASGKRVVKNSRSLKHAGFSHVQPGKYSKTIISTHRSLPGYLVKMYCDDQEGVLEWAKLVDRAKGAIRVRESIEKHKLQSYFKVPKKWIYPLPPDPKGSASAKNFVLIVEDMELARGTRTLQKWKSNNIPKGLLDALYRLIKAAGLRDSVYAFNLPFAKDGRVALVDTEYTGFRHVHYSFFGKYLSKENQEYWNDLTGNSQ